MWEHRREQMTHPLATGQDLFPRGSDEKTAEAADAYRQLAGAFEKGMMAARKVKAPVASGFVGAIAAWPVGRLLQPQFWGSYVGQPEAKGAEHWHSMKNC